MHINKLYLSGKNMLLPYEKRATGPNLMEIGQKLLMGAIIICSLSANNRTCDCISPFFSFD